MKEYLVIFVSFHYNIIEHQKVLAANKAAAMKEYLFHKGWEMDYLEPDEQFIKDMCFNSDILIEAIEL